MEIRKQEEAEYEEQRQKEEEIKEKVRFQEIMKQRQKKLNKQTKPYEIPWLEKKDGPGKESGFRGQETKTLPKLRGRKASLELT